MEASRVYKTGRKLCMLLFCLLPGLTRCDNSLQISFSLTECLPQEWDGFSGLLTGLVTVTTGKACYIKVISVPLFGQNKIQVYLLCILRSGLVCCDYQLADSSSFPAPSVLSLVYWLGRLAN